MLYTTIIVTSYQVVIISVVPVLIQFNLSILDDKQVLVELKRSLEGRLPEAGQPVCVEILMDTAEV